MSKLFKIFFIVFTLLAFNPIRVFASVYINEVGLSDNKIWVEVYKSDGAIYEDLVLSKSYEINEICNIGQSNEKVYLLSEPLEDTFKVISDLTFNLNIESVLYLVSCSEEEVLNSYYVPVLPNNYSYARLVDGVSESEVRNNEDAGLNTQGKSNVLSPYVSNFSFAKSSFLLGEELAFSFNLSSSEENFEKVEYYINNILVDSDPNYSNEYTVELSFDPSFAYFGSNNFTIKTYPKVGKNEFTYFFNTLGAGPKISLDTINNQSFNKNISISGIVSTNNSLQKLKLYYKFANKEEYSLYKEVNLSGVRSSFNFDFSPLEEGEYKLKLVANDLQGESEKEISEKIIYDKSAPSVELKLSPGEPGGKNDYYLSSVEVDFKNIGDGEKVYYKINDGPYLLFDDEFDMPEGENYLYYKSLDSTGNYSSEVKKQIKVDTLRPNIIYNLYPEYPDGLNGFYIEQPNLVLSSTSNDLESLEYRFGEEDWRNYDDPIKIENTFITYYVRSTDKAGNKSEVGEFNLKIALEKPSAIKSVFYKLVGENSIDISFVDRDPQDTYFYEIYRSVDGSVDVNERYFYTALPAGVTNYLDKNLFYGRQHNYLIVKKGKSGVVSDPVKFSVFVPSHNVLGLSTSKIKPLEYLEYKEKSVVLGGNIKGTSTINNKYLLLQSSMVGLVSVCLYILYKSFFKKIKFLNAS